MKDALRVLNLFRNSGGRLIFNGEIVGGNFYGKKRIIEYSGRITDARKIINCKCGKKGVFCGAKEHIKSIKKNYFQYQGRYTDVREKIMTPPQDQIIDTEKELERLREKYREAKSRGDVFSMNLIKKTAKSLKNYPPVVEDFKSKVQKALGFESAPTPALSSKGAPSNSSYERWK